MTGIGERLKKLRFDLKIKQGEFAGRMGLSQGALSDFERETKPMAERYIKLICLEFGVNREWLLTGEGDMFVKKPEQDPPPALTLVDSDGNPLKPDEVELIGIYQNLDPDNKIMARKQVGVILDVQEEAKSKGLTGEKA
ncbi:hypothetical protein AGMMS50268_04130 [Spirochaetia bacterium]|nr:hypothetical protein AGMMS50268_04130 [Spirochaetia bacterium]